MYAHERQISKALHCARHLTRAFYSSTRRYLFVDDGMSLFYFVLVTAVSGGGGKQVLVSNCLSSGGRQPSFVVMLDPATGMVEFTGRTENGDVSLNVPYDVSIVSDLRLVSSVVYRRPTLDLWVVNSSLRTYTYITMLYCM